jgi:hypothetical protein
MDVYRDGAVQWHRARDTRGVRARRKVNVSLPCQARPDGRLLAGGSCATEQQHAVEGFKRFKSGNGHA